MRRLIFSAFIFVLLVFGFYLGRNYLTKARYVVKINNFRMTKEEFEDYFKEINITGEDSPSMREKVLEELIGKKLILQEAEKEGLNKDKEFLKALESYYEQLLFKLIVDEKSKQLGSRVIVTDEEVKQRYNKLVENNLVTKPLEEIYTQIKWQVFREKQTQVLTDWLEELRQRAKIEIDRDAILK